MPQRQLESGKFYHIYNRGHNKQQIFFSPKDYERFYNNIIRYKEKYQNIDIAAWCFLPNHFHFLLIDKSSPSKSNPGSENPGCGLISDFMNRIQQSYAAFFNIKYGETVKKGRKGPIFEGRFKAKIVEDEDYLYQLKKYIEWNAVKHQIVDKPEEWGYSSHTPKTYEDPLTERLEFNPYFE